MIDFSDIPEEERTKNYRPHGGGSKNPESPETEAQKRYEDGTLIVIYTHPSDIPPTPREPADPFSGEYGEAVELGLPSDEILVKKELVSLNCIIMLRSIISLVLNSNKLRFLCRMFQQYSEY